MKILLTAHQFFPEYSSGTEVLTYSVARELIERGHETHILTGFPTDKILQEKERLDEYDFENIHVYRFHHSYTAMAGQTSKVALSYDNHLAATFFGQILGKFKPDIVHFFHLNRLGTGLIDAAVKAGIRSFMTPTDFWAICHTSQLVLCEGSLCQGPNNSSGNCVKHIIEITQKGFIGKFSGMLPTTFFNQVVRSARNTKILPCSIRYEVNAISSRLDTNIARINQLNRIISPNNFMTKLLIRYGVFPNLITQSAYGIDITPSESNIPRSAPARPYRVGFIGSLANHKGCHILIKAFQALPAGQAVLKIYGNVADFPEYVNQLKNNSKYNDSIEFCGTFPNSKINLVLSNLDVLVVPSLWYENTPLVVYSAQASSCPVVASNLPGLSEVIHDKVNGLLFEAGNTAELTENLTRLINEPGLTESLSENSPQPKSTANYVDELIQIWTEV